MGLGILGSRSRLWSPRDELGFAVTNGQPPRSTASRTGSLSLGFSAMSKRPPSDLGVGAQRLKLCKGRPTCRKVFTSVIGDNVTTRSSA